MTRIGITVQSIRTPDEDRLRRAIAAAPADVLLRRELAELLLERGKPGEAVSTLAEALRIDHRDVPTLRLFARAQLKWGNPVEAEQACLLAQQENPNDPETLRSLGEVLLETERVAEAIQLFEEALRLRPDDLEARHSYGWALKSAGRLEEARRQFRLVIEREPGAVRPYYGLSDMETFTADHDLLAPMHLALAAAPEHDSSGRAALSYALGKAYDDLGDVDRAFGFFDSGARLMRAAVDYDEAEMLGMLDRTIDVFSREIVARHPPSAERPTPTPAFIVGMPRSGSTLLEQILSRHPDVHCAGETKVFAEQLALVRRRSPELPLFPELMRAVDPETIAAIAEAYRALLREQAGPARLSINKLLGNFMLLGAIHMVLPDARFIVATRDPIDTCFSIFAQYFDSHIPYSYDLAEIGRFYRKYEQVMAHWQEVLPEGIIRAFKYERVVENLEGEVRALLDFLGLPWHAPCLDFHRSTRPVRSASVAQVRRPLYRTSVGRGHRYERHLQPLIQALG